jgi:hypothetical protein
MQKPILAALLLLAGASPVRGEDPAPPAADPSEVAVVAGDRVNLRVGPRIDGRAVTQLSDGTVLLVVERLGDWVGVRVPAGFPAAIHGRYLEEESPDAVRVAGSEVQLRVAPPEEGKPMPDAFRDQPARGTLLTLISREGDWAWVVAPEDVRAYLSARYVKDVGPLAEHADLVAGARARRAAEAERLAEARRSHRTEAAGLALKAAFGEIQAALYRMRVEGNADKAPVVELADRLDRAIEAAGEAPERVRVLAAALREDLEAEVALAVARRDAELARLRGQQPKAVPLPAPRIESLVATGVIRWEETPGWRDPGVWILWIADRPSLVLRLTTGGPLPYPDFKTNADGRPRRVEGTQPGDRLFGLPVVDVRSISPVGS